MGKKPSVIHFANVTKTYGEITAVQDISVRISEGEIVGFVGPNGAGKTTALSLLMGFLRATKGEITLFGNNVITPETAHKTHASIGYVEGDMVLPTNLTGKQYLDYLAKRHTVDADTRTRLINRLNPQLSPKLKNLSRGNRQKIALIAALQHRPKLLILDEPTSGLDPLMQEVFLSIVAEEAKLGTTVLMSSHILSEIATVCNRILFMKHGMIVQDQTTEEIKAEAGKIITISANKSVLSELKRTLPKSCRMLNDNTKLLKVHYSGDIRIILRWIGAKDIEDVTIEDRELDDIFKNLYRSNTRQNS